MQWFKALCVAVVASIALSMGEVIPERLVVAAALPVQTNTSADKNCEYCEVFTTLIEVAMQQDTTDIDAIREYADMICGMLGEQSLCHQYVDKLDVVVDALKKGESARKICNELKFCVNTAKEALPIAASPVVDRTMWNHSQVAIDSCFFCTQVAALLKVALAQNPDQVAEIREIADLICSVLPISNKCHKFMDNMDHIIDLLRKGKEPHAVCLDMHMCHKKNERLDSVGDQCVYCSGVLTVLEVAWKQKPDEVQAARDMAGIVCDMLPADDKCHNDLKMFDTALSELKAGKGPRAICTDLHFCTTVEKTGFSVVNESSLVVDSTDKPCVYCEMFTTLIEVAMQQDKTDMDEIRAYADMICGMLGDESLCHQYVDKLDLVADALKKGESTRKICDDLKFCVAIQTSEETVTNRPQTCFFCTTLAVVLKTALAQDPDKVTEIFQVADLICNRLPKDNQCHKIMDDADHIMDLLRKGEEPYAVCQDIHICPKTEAVLLDTTMEKSNTCVYCDGVLTVLEIALKQKPDQIQAARDAAGIVCDLLPADDKCHGDLKMFDTALSELKAGKRPHEICKDLHFCTASTKTTPLHVVDFDLSLPPSPCTQCKHNMVLLASVATSPEGLKTFEDALTSICRLIPDANECALLMKHHDLVVDALRQHQDLDSICTRIHTCPAPALLMGGSHDSADFSMGCLLCEYTAEVLVHTNKDIEELRLAKKALEIMCFILPPSANCDVLSVKFDQLVGLVKAGKDANQACQAVTLCSLKQAVVVQREEEEKHVFGTGRIMEIE